VTFLRVVRDFVLTFVNNALISSGSDPISRRGSVMDLYEISTLAVVIVCMILGWVLVGLLRIPMKPFVLALLTIVVATVGALGMTTTLIPAFGYGRLANTALASLCCGAVAAMWRRLRREQRSRGAVPVQTR
jgi:peptidoglycan/LPS O-acetylase OafA/YrhL